MDMLPINVGLKNDEKNVFAHADVLVVIIQVVLTVVVDIAVVTLTGGINMDANRNSKILKDSKYKMSTETGT